MESSSFNIPSYNNSELNIPVKKLTNQSVGKTITSLNRTEKSNKTQRYLKKKFASGYKYSSKRRIINPKLSKKKKKKTKTNKKKRESNLKQLQIILARLEQNNNLNNKDAKIKAIKNKINKLKKSSRIPSPLSRNFTKN